MRNEKRTRLKSIRTGNLERETDAAVVSEREIG